MEPTRPAKPERGAMLLRVPLVPVALALMAGIVAGMYAPLAAGAWALAGAAALIFACVTFPRPHLHLATSIAAAVVVLCIGAFYCRMSWGSVDGGHVVTYTREGRTLASLRGQVVTWPAVVPNDFDAGYHKPPRTVFIIAAEAIKTGESFSPADGLVRVTVDEPINDLQAGRRVELVGWIGRFRGADNPGQADRADIARRNGTLVWMAVPGADGVIASGGAQPWYARAFWRVRAAARQHLAHCGDLEDSRLLNALLVGDRNPALRQLNAVMVRAGTAHYLSISGQHLAIFLGFIYLLCRLLTLSPRRAAMLVLAVLTAYMLLADPQAPLLRSAVMAAALCLGVIFRRQYSSLNALAGAAVVVLAVDPLQLFSAGFQLSFGVVAGLILLRRPMINALFGRWISRRGLMVFRAGERRRRWLYHQAADWGMNAVSMSLVAQIVSVPLLAYHFGLFSPYGALLSVLLAPLVTAVLLPGYVSMALAWPMPGLANTVGGAAAWAADVLQQASFAMDYLPGLCLTLRPVGVPWVLACYGVIAAVALHRRLPRGKLLAVAAVALLAGATVWTQRAAPKPTTAELNVLAVGAGQCALLRTPSGQTAVFDVGTLNGFDAYEEALGPFLRERRLPAPGIVFLSHPHADHCNGMASLLSRGSVRRVYVNGRFMAHAERTGPVAALVEQLRESGVEVVNVAAGDKIALDERTSVEVLWPPPGTDSLPTINDESLVLRIACDGKSVLLAGDIGDYAQSALISAGQVAADAALLPHHGGWEKSLPAFFHAVGARYAVVSASRDPVSKVVASEAAAEFYRQPRNWPNLYSTSHNGWVQLLFGRSGVSVNTMH